LTGTGAKLVGQKTPESKKSQSPYDRGRTPAENWLIRHGEQIGRRLAGDCEEETLAVYGFAPANSGSYSAC
jgi:hypothetical protein